MSTFMLGESADADRQHVAEKVDGGIWTDFDEHRNDMKLNMGTSRKLSILRCWCAK